MCTSCCRPACGRRSAPAHDEHGIPRPCPSPQEPARRNADIPSPAGIHHRDPLVRRTRDDHGMVAPGPPGSDHDNDGALFRGLLGEIFDRALHNVCDQAPAPGPLPQAPERISVPRRSAQFPFHVRHGGRDAPVTGDHVQTSGRTGVAPSLPRHGNKRGGGRTRSNGPPGRCTGREKKKRENRRSTDCTGGSSSLERAH